MPFKDKACQICGKKEGPLGNQFIKIEGEKYVCNEEHLKLYREAKEKNKKICLTCFKLVNIEDFTCTHCGSILYEIKDYEIGNMCPFSVVNVGGTEWDGYTVLNWKHNPCMRGYCAIWNKDTKKCSFISK